MASMGPPKNGAAGLPPLGGGLDICISSGGAIRGLGRKGIPTSGSPWGRTMLKPGCPIGGGGRVISRGIVMTGGLPMARGLGLLP